MRILETITDYAPITDIFTEDEQIETCCEPVSVDDCVEVGKVSEYDGADQDDIDLDQMLVDVRERYTGTTILEIVVEDAPRILSCGQKYETWEGRIYCCDLATDIIWDDAESVEVMADNSDGVIKISGGLPPYDVKIRGNGFYLDANHSYRDGTSSGTSITIFTGDACGSAKITITDGCSSVTGTVKSDDGQWVAVPLSEIPADFRYVDSDTVPTFSGATKRITGYYDEYRVQQYYTRGVGSSLCTIGPTSPCWPGYPVSNEGCFGAAIGALICACTGPLDQTVYVAPQGYAEMTDGRFCIAITNVNSRPTVLYIFYQLYSILVSDNILAHKWVC